MEKNDKIFVAGHKGMVGSAIVRELQKQGYTNIILRTHQELDLTRQQDVEQFFAAEKPDYVFLAAGKVGGIAANAGALADFMYENMVQERNCRSESWQRRWPGSSGIRARFCGIRTSRMVRRANCWT